MSNAMSAISPAWRLPFLTGKPDTTSKQSPIVSTWDKKNNKGYWTKIIIEKKVIQVNLAKEIVLLSCKTKIFYGIPKSLQGTALTTPEGSSNHVARSFSEEHLNAPDICRITSISPNNFRIIRLANTSWDNCLYINNYNFSELT